LWLDVSGVVKQYPREVWTTEIERNEVRKVKSRYGST
jgi:hypothetical protein